MPIIEFEGQTFEFPDDFTDAEISQALAGESSAPSPEGSPSVAPVLTPPEQQAPTSDDPFAGVGFSEDEAGTTFTLPRSESRDLLTDPGAFIAESVLKGITGFGRGLLTLPQDIVRGLASDEISDEDLFRNPILGLTRTIGDIGRKIPRIKGGTTAGDIGGDIAQFAAPTGVVGKAAKVLVPGKGQALATLAGTSLADVAVTDPTQDQSILESVGGVKLDPLESRVQTGVEGGAIGSTLSSIAAVGRALKKGARPFTKEGLESQVGEKLQEFTQKPIAEVTQDIEAGLARQEVPGFQPTTGTLTGDTGLLGFEKGAISDPDLLARARENKTALSAEVQNILRTEGDPADLKAFAEQKAALTGEAGEDALRAAQRAQDVAENEVNNLLASTPGSAGGRGQASRQIDKAAQEVLKQKTILKNQKFNLIDPQGTVETNVDDTLDLLKGLRPTSAGDLSGKEFLNSRIVKALKSFTQKVDIDPTSGIQRTVPRNPTFKEINDLRPAVSAEIQAARIAGKGDQVTKLEQVRAFINNQADVLAAQGSPAGVRAKEATSFFKKEFAPLFGEGAGAQFRKGARTFTGEPTATASSFLQRSSRAGGAQESAQQLSRIIDALDDPSSAFTQVGKPNAAQAGRQAVRDFIIEDLGASLQGKTAKQAAPIVRNFQKANADNLNAFPQAAKEVEDLAKGLESGLEKVNRLGDEVADVTKAIKETSKLDATSALKKLAKLDNPVRTIDGVLSSPTGKTEFDKLFLATKGNKEARAGLKAAVSESLRDKIIRTTDLIEGEVSPAKINQVLNDPTTQSVMKRLFKKSEIAALGRVQKRVQEAGRINQGVTTGSQTAALTISSQRAANIFASVYGIAKGRGLFTLSRIVMEGLTGGNVKDRMNAIIAQSMTDPAYAKMLLNLKLGDNVKEARRVALYTLNNVFTDERE